MSKPTIRLAVTGHRANRLGGYSAEAKAHVIAVAKKAIPLVPDVREVIVGMALGWDMACASACKDLDIPFTAAVPFMGQEGRWPQTAKDEYNDLLSFSSRFVVVSEGLYSPAKMFARNNWMLDESDALLSLYDPKAGKSGTLHCIEQALKRGMPVYDAWSLFTGQSEELTLLSLDDLENTPWPTEKPLNE